MVFYDYDYDNNGNLVKKTEKETGVAWEYEFNLLNRLTAVRRTESGTTNTVASYLYDEAGFRIKKESAEKGSTWYVFSANGVVLYEEKTGGDYKEYIYVFNDLFAKVEGTTVSGTAIRTRYFYHTDHLGNTVAISNEAGVVVWKNEYSPFGAEAGYEGMEEHEGKFTGKDFDEEISLYYFNARWYDPELGRFISVDPIKDGVNWYVYCSNNPLIYIDPTGLEGQRDESYNSLYSSQKTTWVGQTKYAYTKGGEVMKPILAFTVLAEKQTWYRKGEVVSADYTGKVWYKLSVNPEYSVHGQISAGTSERGKNDSSIAVTQSLWLNLSGVITKKGNPLEILEVIAESAMSASPEGGSLPLEVLALQTIGWETAIDLALPSERE